MSKLTKKKTKNKNVLLIPPYYKISLTIYSAILKSTTVSINLCSYTMSHLWKQENKFNHIICLQAYASCAQAISCAAHWRSPASLRGSCLSPNPQVTSRKSHVEADVALENAPVKMVDPETIERDFRPRDVLFWVWQAVSRRLTLPSGYLQLTQKTKVGSAPSPKQSWDHQRKIPKFTNITNLKQLQQP